MSSPLQNFTLHTPEGLALVGDVRRNPKNAGVAVVVHGIGGYRHEPLIQALSEAAYDAGLTVVHYDGTHSFGGSDGDLIDMRFSTFAQDLLTVLTWVKQQSWGHGPFTLMGHSLGAATCLHYAAHQPQDVVNLVLVSCVVGGSRWLKAHQEAIPDTLRMWQENGFLPKTHPIRKDHSGKISWAYAQDIQQRDFIKNDAPCVTCPVLLVVGSIDPITPVTAQEDLQRALAGDTELHVIPGCGHTFKSATQQQILKDIIVDWLP